MSLFRKFALAPKAAAVVMLAACGSGPSQSFAPTAARDDSGGGQASGDSASLPSAELESVASDRGQFRVAVRTAPDQPPSVGVSTVQLRITSETGAPIDGLVLTIVPWMPSMGHGSSVRPTVRAGGNGLYEAVGVSLMMPGTWQLRVAIASADGGEMDHATILLHAH